MWILNWLPDFVFHLILIVGVLAIIAGYFLDNIPFIGTNAKTIQIAGILLTVVGVWFEGGIANNARWEKRVAELEIKIARAEAESAELNARLAQQLAQNQILINQNAAAQRDKLKAEAALLNKECKVNNRVIGILNDAAKNHQGDAK